MANVETTKFQAGRSYSCRSICDYDCVFTFDVVKRTEKTVTLAYQGRQVRRTISLYDGVEQCSPHGRYSMSPILTAKGN